VSLESAAILAAIGLEVYSREKGRPTALEQAKIDAATMTARWQWNRDVDARLAEHKRNGTKPSRKDQWLYIKDDRT